MDIAGNLAEVQQRVQRAAEASGRNLKEIQLLAVSKTMPVPMVEEAYRAGQRAFAENRVQEWQEKAPLLPADCEWHIVGRLQTNKVKYLNERIALIHSLDRWDLFQALKEQGEKRGIVWPVLIQVNVARDPAKAGLFSEEVADFLAAVQDCPFVSIRGLMTIGALDASSDDTRGFFRELYLLRDGLRQRGWAGLAELSMGMSQDFEIAIEEGATIIRVGRQIFGER